MRSAKSYSFRFSKQELRNLYYSKIGASSVAGVDKILPAKFTERLDENIDLIKKKTEIRSYHFTNYRQVLASKGAKKLPREICIPTVRDRLVLAALSKILDDVFKETAQTPMPQALIAEIISSIRSGNYDSYIKYDLSRFYASIPHEKLMKRLRRSIRKPQVLCLIERAICTPSAPFGSSVRQKRDSGIPEGLSISNKLANVYASDIDKHFLSIPNIAYYRYVDDILILCKQEHVANIDGKMKTKVSELNLELHETKSLRGLLSTSSFDYLGYSFCPGNTVSVRRASIRNLETSLEEHMRGFSRAKNEKLWYWQLNLRITGCRISEDSTSFERYGWLHYFSKLNDLGLLCHLDWLIGILLTRFGISTDGKEIKSFRKAYRDIKRHPTRSEYIPCFINGESIEKKKAMLEILFGVEKITEMSDEDIDSIFNKKVRREAKRLERDVGLIS